MAYYERRLPHWHPKGRDVFLTWRLEGSLPKSRFIPPAGLTTGQAFGCIDRLLDQATFGPSWLRRPEIAQSLVDALRYAAERRVLAVANFDGFLLKRLTLSYSAARLVMLSVARAFRFV
jgi:hypothetical protein